MKSCAVAVAMLIACLAGACPAAEEGSGWEQLRAGVKADGRVGDPRLEDATGWQVVRGFRWQLELEDAKQRGKFAPADPAQTFRHGQRFRVRLEALCDLYVYVLVRNPDGSEVVLVPERAEQVPQVKQGHELLLPPDGGTLRFTPPSGAARLRLLAAPRELPWVASRELFKLQSGQELTAQEQAALEQLKAVRSRSVDDALCRQEKFTAVKGLPAAVKAIAAGELPRGCEVIAVEAGAKGQLVFHSSADPKSQAILVHDIELKHGE